MNEIEKPNKCAECNNKPYGKNYLSPNDYEWLCRQHYFLCVYGIDYNAGERVKGGYEK